jgi:hypothetical protein
VGAVVDEVLGVVLVVELSVPAGPVCAAAGGATLSIATTGSAAAIQRIRAIEILTSSVAAEPA